MRSFNKKRIGIILFSLVISISLIRLNKNNQSIQTMAWGGNNKTIVLDAGHGYPDERGIK